MPCPVCKGTGADQFASYVASVQKEIGEETKSNTVLVDDWDSGPKQVELFKDMTKLPNALTLRGIFRPSFPCRNSCCSWRGCST